jgi:hypothetical protein
LKNLIFIISLLTRTENLIVGSIKQNKTLRKN